MSSTDDFIMTLPDEGAPGDGDLSGSWTYRFAGDKAKGVSGLVTLNHQYIQPTIADDYLEIGVFMADRDGPVTP